MRLLNISKTGYKDSAEIKKRITLAEGKMLNRKEQEALFLCLKNGENDVINKLIDSYEWLITNIAKRYINKGKKLKSLCLLAKLV